MGHDEAQEQLGTHGRLPDGRSGGPGMDGCGFVVVRDPQRVMRSWRAACRDADRVRAALAAAELTAVFGTVRADLNAAGEPVVVLGGVATAPDVARLVDMLTSAPVRRVDGVA